MYSFDELKALKHQPVYEFYAKCDVPFKNTIDLSHYHEKCVRWDDGKQWPNIGNLLNMVNKSPEAIAFKKMYKELARSKVTYPTLTIKWRDPQIEGKSYYEYIPQEIAKPKKLPKKSYRDMLEGLEADKHQDAFDFYAKCDVPFKNHDDLHYYHERCVRYDSDKLWPDIDKLYSAAEGNKTPGAIAFKKMYKKLKKNIVADGWYNCEINCTINIQKRIPYIPGKSYFEYIPGPLTEEPDNGNSYSNPHQDNLVALKQQPVFDFYAKCEVPFETLEDLGSYHEKCVRWDADKEWHDIKTIYRTENDSPEAISFKKMYNGLKKEFKLTINIQEREHKTPGKSWFEYIPVSKTQGGTAGGKEFVGLVNAKSHNVVNTRINQGVQMYVYLITYPGGFVKVGRHSGAIKGLIGRYNTHTPTYEIEYFKCMDYINIEQAIHKVLTAYGFHDHLEFFKDTPQVREVWKTFKEMNVKYN